jgi:hypothetical protein
LTDVKELRWSSTFKQGFLCVTLGIGRGEFTLVETGSALEVGVEDERQVVGDYMSRPLLVELVRVFSADRHASLDPPPTWNVFSLRDAACRAWEEMIAIEEAAGRYPFGTLLGHCLFTLALAWANAYGPRPVGN